MAQVMTRGMVKSRFIFQLKNKGQSAAKCQVYNIWYAVHRLDGG